MSHIYSRQTVKPYTAKFNNLKRDPQLQVDVNYSYI